MTPVALVAGLTMGTLGLVSGLVYFSMLKRTAVLLSVGRGRLDALALTLARIALAIIVLAGAARMGALQLLAAFMGFLLARALALQSARKTG